VIVGNFVILDSSFVGATERKRILPASDQFPQPEDADFVEFAFGKNEGTFSGSHRIEVQRESNENGTETEESVIVVKWSQVRGNPTQDGIFTLKWLDTFHKVYAMSLFANGVSEILKGGRNV
jgi:hypothetical protein